MIHRILVPTLLLTGLVAPTATAAARDTLWTPPQRVVRVIPGTLPYAEGDLMSANQLAALADLAARYRGRTDLRVTITAHVDRLEAAADEPGRRSTARARRAADWLATQPGWDRVVIAVVGGGRSTEAAPCGDLDGLTLRSCLEADRRLEVELWYGGESTPGVAPACAGADTPSGRPPFRITVDGIPADSTAPRADEIGRCQDRHLALTSVQVRLDPLDATPRLNVAEVGGGAVRGRPVAFVGYDNYAAWIVRRELRIFAANASTQGTPFAVVPATGDGQTFVWSPTGDATAFRYLLRVYDASGAFDETRPRRLEVAPADVPSPARASATRERAVGYGEDSRLIGNIAVHGAAVTVSGEAGDSTAMVLVQGRMVPVGRDGRFAARELLPLGSQIVTVTVTDAAGARTTLQRDLTVRRQAWFSVMLADLTIGQNRVRGPAALVTGEDSRRQAGDTYASGRLAFYAKGRLDERTRLTASADTREQPLGDLFSNFGRRDPLALLRRLDPNTAYPVYGDDATLIVDAPTQGNAYLRIDRDDSHLMWGSFQTRLAGSDLVDFSRGLYGGELGVESRSTTHYGERRTEVTAFAADPGTVGAREEFRGTGGSLYYLQNQDLVLGSERLRVEIRDRDSDLILESTTLLAGQDYELNALQGRIVLRSPLSSVAPRPGTVRVGALDGNRVFLVATYEYAPGVTRADNLTTGGRATHWLTDGVRLGVTGYDQGGNGMEQRLLGGDLTIRSGPGSYLRLERARSEGAGNGTMLSADGGFGFATVPQLAGDDRTAMASRAELALDLGELSRGQRAGTLTTYWLEREAGFSTPGQLTNEAVDQVGFSADLPVGSRLDLSARGDLRDGAQTGTFRALELGAGWDASSEVDLRLGLRQEHRDGTGLRFPGTGGAGQQEIGTRSDAVARLGWTPRTADGTARRYSLYGLAQGTLARDGTRRANDRFGAGGRYQFNPRLALTGEVTDGALGTGGLAGVDYQVTDRSSLYLNYLVDVDRPEQGMSGRTGTFATGGQVRFTDATSVFVERRLQRGGQGQAGLVHAFGLDIAPTDRWRTGLKLEQGTLQQPGLEPLDRRAASVSAGYATPALQWGGVLEVRTDEGGTVGRRTSWLVKNTLGVQASRDWRMLGRANVATSSGGALAGADADYTEMIVGLAYRPVHHNRVNALFRYTFLHDQSSPGQLGARLQANPFAQRSQVLSADAIVAVAPRLSLGGKVGYRFGEVRDHAIPDAEWIGSRALLGVARADWQLWPSWSVLAELRSLNVREAGSTRTGVLLSAYRTVGDNLKIGLGYNFTDYSDDLTDLSYRSRGLFVNVIGRQ